MTSQPDGSPEKEAWIPESAVGQRLDVALAALLSDYSRSFLTKLLKDGAILVDGQAIKPHRKVKGGERVSMDWPEPEVIEAVPEDIALDIIFEDSDIAVVNKPVGMPAHPSAGHATGTLVNALLAHCKDLSSINGALRPGIVHRLDMDTTGVIVTAKNDRAHRALQEQFADRTVRKTYWALCHGNPLQPLFECSGWIGRHPVRRTEMTIMRKPGEGREAFTAFEVLERYAKRGGLLPGARGDDAFFAQASPRTGRTHQIRVHLAKSGYPILSDKLYGLEDALPELGLARQALHACKLELDHPRTGQRMVFEAPLPADMAGARERLRG